MNKINYSPLALNDMDEIWNYISNELLNPTAANDTINGILDNVEKIKEHPESGSPLYFDDIFSGYRFVMFKNYLAFYRISGSDIYVDRVLYVKRDFMKILFGNL